MLNSKRVVVSFVVSTGIQFLAPRYPRSLSCCVKTNHPEESVCCKPGPACRTGCRELRYGKAPLSHHFLNCKGIAAHTACMLWRSLERFFLSAFVEAKASFLLILIYIYNIIIYIYTYTHISINAGMFY